MNFNDDELYAEMESYYKFILEESHKHDYEVEYKNALDSYRDIYGISESYDSYYASVQEGIQSVWNSIINFFRKLGSKIKEYFNKFANWIKKIFNKIFGEDENEKIEVPVDSNTPDAKVETKNGVTTAIVLVSPKETAKYNKLAQDKLHYLDMNTYAYTYTEYPEIDWDTILQTRFNLLDEAYNNLNELRNIVSSGNYNHQDMLKLGIFFENAKKKTNFKEVMSATKVKSEKVVLTSTIAGNEIAYKDRFETQIRYQIDERNKMIKDILSKRIDNGEIEKILNEFAAVDIPENYSPGNPNPYKPINAVKSFQSLVVNIDRELREILNAYSRYEISHYTQAKKVARFVLELKVPTTEATYNILNLI